CATDPSEESFAASRDHASQVGGSHPFVITHSLRRPLDQHPSLLHHRHRVRYVHDDPHVVLNQNDRVVAAQIGNERLHVVQIVDPHTGGGFVQKDGFGLGR